LAVAVAIALVPGINVWASSPLINQHPVISVALLAMVLALLNTTIKPFLQAISLPFTMLTFGIFALVVNTGVLYLASWISNWFGAGIAIDSFLSALFASVLISIVTAVLNALTGVNGTRSGGDAR
jgi:putative membrane protein